MANVTMKEICGRVAQSLSEITLERGEWTPTTLDEKMKSLWNLYIMARMRGTVKTKRDITIIKEARAVLLKYKQTTG